MVYDPGPATVSAPEFEGTVFPMTADAEITIRMNRAAFNRALAEADLTAIGRCLAPSAVLVAGTDSALISGRKAQLTAWKREFAAPERVVYLRQPETILVSDVEPIAFEHGRWSGTVLRSGASTATGAYTAKWRRTGGDWVIEAELYLTLG
jgi:ketosteroid isomerase-like protein